MSQKPLNHLFACSHHQRHQQRHQQRHHERHHQRHQHQREKLVIRGFSLFVTSFYSSFLYWEKSQNLKDDLLQRFLQ